jgi:hypothetical protein
MIRKSGNRFSEQDHAQGAVAKPRPRTDLTGNPSRPGEFHRGFVKRGTLDN